jgi:prophage regulatory protein
MKTAQNTPASKPEKYLRLKAVEELTAMKKSFIYSGINAGTFPAPVRMGARAVAWPESAIANWQAQRQQSRGQ